MLPAGLENSERLVQPIWSLGFNATAFLPASIASLKRPSFISAMPRACQPSKNWASSSTQWRYFSTALSSSPTARSPFASSKISSRVGIVQRTTITRSPNELQYQQQLPRTRWLRVRGQLSLECDAHHAGNAHKKKQEGRGGGG